jgi:alpha-glucoside transport system substrate-binding protein
VDRRVRDIALRSGRAALPSTVLLALVVAACSGTPQASVDPVIRVVASWTGRELDAFNAVVQPFEDRTGYTVDYTATRDLPGTLSRPLADGHSADLAGLAGPQHMAELARAGRLRDLRETIDLRAYKEAVAPTFIDLGTVDGRLVGVFIRSAVKGLVWFNPAVHTHDTPTTWSELELMVVQMGETKPWCLGLESAEASGWPGTDWIENFLIRQSGTDVYDEWAAGRLAWTSSEVTRAWRAYGKVAAESVVFGGVRAALETNFADAGEPLFSNPPGCLFLQQGSFMPTFWTDDDRRPGRDFDFFPFPEVSPDHHGAVVGAGDLFGLLSDSRPARELIAYLVSAEAQSLWVAAGGGLSVHAKVTAYPDSVSSRAAEMVSGAAQFRFDASDLMPAELNAAFWRGVLDFTADPSRLPTILANLDSIRARVYGS